MGQIALKSGFMKDPFFQMISQLKKGLLFLSKLL